MKKINKNDRKKYLIRGIVLLLIGVVLGYFVIKDFSSKEENPFEDAKKIDYSLKFKKEYEQYNDNKDYLNVSISKNNPVKYINSDDLVQFLETGTGIIYFGFPECPWCRNAVPVLLDALKTKNIKELYYLNIKDIRDKKVLDETGKVSVEKEGTDIYKLLLDKLENNLDVYDGLNDESIKRLYAPTVFFISNGEIVGKHVATLESQTDPKITLTEEQKEELKNIYLTNIDKVYSDVCDLESDGC